MFTDEEIAEAGERARAELKAQGLPFAITDPSALVRLAHDLNALSESPVNLDARRVEHLVAVRGCNDDRVDVSTEVTSTAV